MADVSPLPMKTPHLEARDFIAAYTGAGAAAPVKAATTLIPAADNYAQGSAAVAATRSGVGVYVLNVSLRMKLPTILWFSPQVIGTDGKTVTVTAFSIAAGVFTVSVLAWTAAGVAVDLAATDTLFLRIFGRDSKA